MVKIAQLVMGPAGAGKSTYCKHMIEHIAGKGRTAHLFNMDPAAEGFEVEPSIDVRDLISLEDVMEEIELGPNGGLVYCLEYLIDNPDWLLDQLDDFSDDYILVDTPGQIELYTHIPVIPRLVNLLQQQGYRICAVFLMESQFAMDEYKYFAGVLTALSCMVQLEVPHVNLLSKMDLVDEKQVERHLMVDATLLKERPGRLHNLTESIVQLIEDYNMVGFTPLNIYDEESLEFVLTTIDYAMQYDEDVEPKEPKEVDCDDE